MAAVNTQQAPIIHYGESRDRTATITNQVGTDAYQANLGEPIKRVPPTFTDLTAKYFDKTGDDGTGTGTSALPYLTAKKAIEEADLAGWAYVVCQDSGEYLETDIVSTTNPMEFQAAAGETPVFKLSSLTKTSLDSPSSMGNSLLFSDTFKRFYYTREVAASFNRLSSVDIPGITTRDSTYEADWIVEYLGEIYGIAADRIRKTTGGATFGGALSSDITTKMATDGTYLFIYQYDGVSQYKFYYTTDGSSYTQAGTAVTGVFSIAAHDGILYYDNGSDVYYSADLGNTFTSLATIILVNPLTGMTHIKVLNDTVYFWTASKVHRINNDYSTTKVLDLSIMGMTYDNGYFYLIDKSLNTIKRYNESFSFVDSIITEASTDIRTIAIKNSILIYTTSNDNVYQVLLNPLTIISDDDFYVKGIEFDGNNIGAGLILGSGGDSFVEYIQLKNQKVPSSLDYFRGSNTEIDNSIISDSEYGLNTTGIGGGSYNLFYNISECLLEFNGGTLTGVDSWTFYNCAKSIFDLIQLSSFDINNFIILDNTTKTVDNTGLVSDYPVLKYSVYNTELGNIDKDEATTEVARAMFRDVANNDYRLKVIEAQASNGEYYAFDSPGKGAGLAGVDCGAYRFTYANNDTLLDQSIILDFMPISDKIEHSLTRYSTQSDMSGDGHKFHFAQRPVFTLEWPSEGVQDYRHFYQLLALIEQDKPVQVNFNGDIGLEAGSGTFSKTNLTLRDSLADFAINRWRGYWVRITDSGTDYDYFVAESKGDLLTLTDLKGHGLAGADVADDYKILYMNCIVTMEELSGSNQVWDSFGNFDNRITPNNYNLILQGYFKDIT